MLQIKRVLLRARGGLCPRGLLLHRLPMIPIAIMLLMFGWDFIHYRDLTPDYLSWYPFPTVIVEPIMAWISFAAGALILVSMFIRNQIPVRISFLMGFVAIIVWSAGFFIKALAVHQGWLPVSEGSLLTNGFSRLTPAVKDGVLAMFLLLSAMSDWSKE